VDLKELVLRIKGEPKGAVDALGMVQNATSKLGGIVRTIVAGAAVAAMVKWTDTTIQLGIEAERAAGVFAATMRTSINATDEQIAATQKWAEEQEKLNRFDAEVLMGQMNKALVKYGDLETAQLAVSAAQEVARLKGIDVAAAYELVQGASNGTARSLKQFGLEAEEGTTQAGYLQQILDKTNGSTEAFNKTTAGMVEGMKLSYEVMRETLGQALLPIANALMEKLSPAIQGISDWLAANGDKIQGFVDALLKGIEWIVETAGKMWDALKPSFEAIKDTFGPYIRDLFDWLGTKGVSLQTVLVGVAEAIGTAFRIVAAVIQGIVDAITWIIGEAKEISAGVGATDFTGMNNWRATPSVPAGGHASGGWVGMNGPEIGLLGEKGPEYIQSNKEVVDNTSLLKAIASRLDTLISVTSRVPAGVGAAINGLGRGV
jgi:hypothetical protein